MKKLLNILLVDDSKVSNKFNRTLIEELAISKIIRECSSGKEALRFLREQMNDVLFPDLIFLDLVMPEMSGFSFLEKYNDLQLNFKDGFKPVIVILSDHVQASNFSKSNSFTTYGIFEQFEKPLQQKNIQYLLEKYF